MTDNMNNGNGPSEVETRIERAFRERASAVDESLAQGPARTTEETAFLDGQRTQWLTTEEARPAAGRGVLHPSPFGGRTRRPRLHVWAPMAAAAAILFGVWLGGGLTDSNPQGNGDGTSESGAHGPSGVYLGTSVDSEQVFDGSVDWSESGTAQAFYQIVIRDADATKAGDASFIDEVTLWKGNNWTCPPDVLKKLTPHFVIEVYGKGADENPAAAWTGYFRLR